MPKLTRMLCKKWVLGAISARGLTSLGLVPLDELQCMWALWVEKLKNQLHIWGNPIVLARC